MDVSGSLKNQWGLACNETFTTVFQKGWKSSKEENADAGKDLRQKEKRVTKDEMVR